jgi:hypothetical protein
MGLPCSVPPWVPPHRCWAGVLALPAACLQQPLDQRHTRSTQGPMHDTLPLQGHNITPAQGTTGATRTCNMVQGTTKATAVRRSCVSAGHCSDLWLRLQTDQGSVPHSCKRAEPRQAFQTLLYMLRGLQRYQQSTELSARQAPTGVALCHQPAAA